MAEQPPARRLCDPLDKQQSAAVPAASACICVASGASSLSDWPRRAPCSADSAGQRAARPRLRGSRVRRGPDGGGERCRRPPSCGTCANHGARGLFHGDRRSRARNETQSELDAARLSRERMRRCPAAACRCLCLRDRSPRLGPTSQATYFYLLLPVAARVSMSARWGFHRGVRSDRGSAVEAMRAARVRMAGWVACDCVCGGLLPPVAAWVECAKGV